MNERIRELAEKSYIYDKQNDSSFFSKEKFARLIVRECAQVAEEVDGDSRARKCVLEHFGVEE